MRVSRGGAGLLAAAIVWVGGTGPGPQAARQGPTLREFTVVAERYRFTPERIEVNEGDTVRLVVTSADGTHGLAIKKLKVDREIPKGGAPVAIEFVAERAGAFPVSCSQYCGTGHSRMKAILIVNPVNRPGTR